MTTNRSADPDSVILDRETRSVTFQRVFAAPRPTVFAAWSSCEQLARWWGPTDWSLPVCRQEFRPGGSWLYGMQGPAGDPRWGDVVSYGLGVYETIEEPERITYRDHFADADGNPLPDMPVMTIDVRFEDLGEATRLISTTTFASVEDFDRTAEMGMVEGMQQTFDRLDHVLTA